MIDVRPVNHHPCLEFILKVIVGMRIVLCFPVEENHVQQIAATVPDWDVVNAGQEKIATEILGADIFCGHAKVPVPWAKVVQQGKMTWIQSSAAGLDHCLTPEVIASPIQVTSAAGLFANQVAEQTMALLYGITRKLPTFSGLAQKHQFVRMPTGEVHRTTIGIVGLGGNGRRIAQFLAPLKQSWSQDLPSAATRIIATDVYPVDKPSEVDELWPADQLDRLLSQSDIVILCVPLNENTTHLINQSALETMKRGATLINVARGPVVDETALVAALDSGQVGAAGIDVTEVEPLDDHSPLWDRENVLITPHVGAQSARRVSDTVDFFCENLLRFRADESLYNLVDKRLGFPEPGARLRWC